ncbi:hypothetical protein HPB52_019384 [Rhipicephalus sanguineus]|uniref:Carboxylesterase type B domain-containing protein n=1 Tax=Rhipicephalus sanguineus TaxID=34632 RepID=A0A9D4SR68_RHISA|nr:hypothetical protein HPB52_019384 [Rhipicephalus sanguineus]
MLKGNHNLHEDCLYLNVWAPVAATDSAPGLYLYGSMESIHFWSANTAIYNAVWLAALGDVVVVSMNYRLGILGFMNANSPEAPDMALKWVQRTSTLRWRPRASDVVWRKRGPLCVHTRTYVAVSEVSSEGFMMSGTMYNLDSWDTVQESVAKADKCGRNLELHENKPTDELLKASFVIVAPKRAPFVPTYHDEFLPRNPLVAMKRGFFSSVDVLAGVNSMKEPLSAWSFGPRLLAEDLQDFPREELVQSLRAALGRLLRDGVPDILETYIQEVHPGDNNALRRQYIDHLSDRLFNCPLQFFAEKHSERGNKVFCYVFAHKTMMFPLPAWMGAPMDQHTLHVWSRLRSGS